MANFCYLIGDETSKTCALVDPAFETERILDEVNRLGYKINDIINTHGHSDHTAGNGAIKAATGARVLIHELEAKRLGKVLHKTFSRLLGGKGSPSPDVLLQESDRIHAVATELSRLGVSVQELPDGLEVWPSPVTPAAVQTYDDHRIAMSFALIGLKVPGMRICDPACVGKTFPDYFARLDALR